MDTPYPDRLSDITEVWSVFQPIVHLETGYVVGYEALARGPSGSALERPGALFAAAREQGLVAQMDWTCLAAAYRAALANGLTVPWTLFVNMEAETIGTDCPSALQETIAAGRRTLRTVVEVTERALTDSPAELLHRVEELRMQGSGIALDDVGADWRSLALMPFIRPDVVKLDLHLIQQPMTSQTAMVGEAVRAYAAASGAQIVAEGIETEEHLQRAIGLGATFGQGWIFGRPELLPRLRERTMAPAPALAITHQPAIAGSPFETIASLTATAIAPKADLLALSRAIEQRAADTTEPCVILTVFEEARRFTATEAALYSTLAERSSFVGVFGHDMPPEPAPGVRGGDALLNEQLGEWAVTLVAPHYAVALVALDLGDDGPDRARRYRYAFINDREIVLRAARVLVLRTRALPAAAVERRGLAA